MRKTIRHGAIVCCDVVTKTETDDAVLFTDQCSARFTTYSMVCVARAQAKASGWIRVKVGMVKWPGLPPMADYKLVDLCPSHVGLVMSLEERQAKIKRDADARKAERAAKKASEPKRPRKKKAEEVKLEEVLSELTEPQPEPPPQMPTIDGIPF